MATTTLTNTTISETYVSLLHSNGEILPSTGQQWIYDGCGNRSSIKLGRNCNGLTVCGTLSADSIITGSITSTDWLGIVNVIYPIGSIYLSYDDVNPSTRWIGTTWSRVSEGRYLAGVGTGTDGAVNKTLSVGDVIGSYQVTLTEAQLPAHRHNLRHPDTGEQFYVINDGNFSGGGVDTSREQGPNDSDDARYYPYTNFTGNNQPHENTPPGYAVYVWRRTA